jgi:Spy/CpxP family protein refolding chaperone
MDTNSTAAPARPRRRKFLLIAGVAAALGLGGAAVAQGYGHHFGPGMMGGGMMGRGGPMAMDPAAMADMADRGVRHMAIEIDATPEQQEKLRAIARDLVKDLAPMRTARQEAAQRVRELLTQTTIDKAAIEKFRAEELAKVDAASKRVTQALGDAAEILTPEQRAKLAERMPRPGAGPFWRRG